MQHMLLMLLVFAAVVALDQGTKALVTTRLTEGAATTGTVFGARLRHVVNRRKPWGSVAGVRLMAITWLVLVVGGGVIAGVFDKPAAYVAIGATMAGATGNLIDGMSRHAVTDFIDLRVWPVFNVADAAIVGGIAFILVSAVRVI